MKIKILPKSHKCSLVSHVFCLAGETGNCSNGTYPSKLLLSLVFSTAAFSSRVSLDRVGRGHAVMLVANLTNTPLPLGQMSPTDLGNFTQVKCLPIDTVTRM